MPQAEASLDSSGMPLVTIVTPAYNQAEYLVETIESVLAQDYSNIEYIVIDDGSTDATPEILKRYEGRIRRETQKNVGQAASLNRGWSMANGRYLGYLSSDDVLYQSAIRELVNCMESHPGTVMVYPDCDLIDPYSKLIKENVAKPFDYDELVITQECTIGPGALFRRECFVKLGGWETWLKLAPDREFWMRVGLFGEIKMLHKTLAAYRMHSASISYSEVAPESANEYLAVLDKFYERTDIPESLVLRKNEAYANARLSICRNSLRNRDYSVAFSEYRKATRLNPDLKRASVWLRLARTVISKPVRKVHWMIRKITGF